jgi:predicted Ser/Thr protein kinase
MGLDPTTIGRYVVLGTLGQGAMGTVYLGEDPMLKRGVALKVVHASQAQGRELALRRFRREAEISAKLNHPNVITVFDVGEEEGVGPFLAMEFIEGAPLNDLLRQGALAPQKAMEILVQAAAAMEAAHALGIVHRDIKPANLMVAKDGRVKLMDFGISMEEDQTSTTSALLCTPGYAAPELLDGAKASAATDRWAFAVTAYECLGGKAPFEGENISVVLYNVAHGEPVFPGDLDPALAATFRKALSKHPGDRHSDLAGFLGELAAALPLEETFKRRLRKHLGQAPEAKPEAAASGPVRQPWEQRRVKILSWAAGFLALGALLFLGWWEGLLLPRRFHVESEPSGAHVYVDGKPSARTPVLDLKVPGRIDEILVELDGYYPYPQKLSAAGSAFRLRLTPRFLYLNFDSRPSRAEVYVNGKLIGETPLQNAKVRNDLRNPSLLVKRDGFELWATSIDEKNLPPSLIILTPEKAGK